jgi:hypothetical protein
LHLPSRSESICTWLHPLKSTHAPSCSECAGKDSNESQHKKKKRSRKQPKPSVSPLPLSNQLRAGRSPTAGRRGTIRHNHALYSTARYPTDGTVYPHADPTTPDTIHTSVPRCSTHRSCRTPIQGVNYAVSVRVRGHRRGGTHGGTQSRCSRGVDALRQGGGHQREGKAHAQQQGWGHAEAGFLFSQSF